MALAACTDVQSSVFLFCKVTQLDATCSSQIKRFATARHEELHLRSERAGRCLSVQDTKVQREHEVVLVPASCEVTSNHTMTRWCFTARLIRDGSSDGFNSSKTYPNCFDRSRNLYCTVAATSSHSTSPGIKLHETSHTQFRHSSLENSHLLASILQSALSSSPAIPPPNLWFGRNRPSGYLI